MISEWLKHRGNAKIPPRLLLLTASRCWCYISTMAYQKNKSLGDGIEVLEALVAADHSLGSRELARMLDMEHTRTNRILRTLAEVGMAEQDSNHRYQPGPGIHLLSSLSLQGSALLARALPVMEVSRDNRYTMALGVLWRDHVSYLVHADPDIPLISALGRICPYPAGKSSIGKILKNPDNRRGYAAVKHMDHYSVAVAVKTDRPLAGIAYSGVSSGDISVTAKELKTIARTIEGELKRDTKRS